MGKSKVESKTENKAESKAKSKAKSRTNDKANDENVWTKASVITKQDTFFVDENGEFVNYSVRSKYNPRYCQELINFFNIPPYEEKNIMTEKGKVYSGRVANEMPLLARFATKIGVSSDVLYSWAEKNIEFAEAMNQARDLQEYILVTNSLLGLYTANIAIFSLKNLVNWKNEPDMFVAGKVTVEGIVGRISNKNAKVDLLSQAREGLAIGSTTESK